MPLHTANSPLSTLAQMSPQLQQLPDGPSLDQVRGPVEIPAYEPWQIALFIALGLLAAALLIWGMIAILRSCRNRTPEVSPQATALAELDTAAQLTTGDDERFAVLSSLALRRYFEEGLNIRSTARTSEEFLNSLKGTPRIEEEDQSALANFLSQCDAIKFARMPVAPEQRNALTETAKELIKKTVQTKEVAQP